MSLETATLRAASKPDLTFVILIHQSLRADAARLAATIAALSPDDRTEYPTGEHFVDMPEDAGHCSAVMERLSVAGAPPDRTT
jgi:hypothetical protein